MSLLPPGVVPNYVDPPDHKEQTIILHTICLTLITSSVLMRLYTRFFITKSGGIDDGFIIFSWAASVSWSGALIGGGNYGIGRHLWDIPPGLLVPGLKILFTTELLYSIIAPATKISLLLCFVRIFRINRIVQFFIWFGIFAVVVFYTVTFFDTLFLCKPVAASWDPSIKGTCQSQKPLPYASGIFGFISDFYIFFLPIPTIWSLNMPSLKKIRLMLAFGIGLFACVASIMRFVYTLKLVDNQDETWNYATLSVWAVLEVDIGIVCACLHTLPAFLHRYVPEKWSYYFSSYMHRLASYVGLNSKTQSFLGSSDTPKKSSGQEIYAGGYLHNKRSHLQNDEDAWMSLRDV